MHSGGFYEESIAEKQNSREVDSGIPSEAVDATKVVVSRGAFEADVVTETKQSELEQDIEPEYNRESTEEMNGVNPNIRVKFQQQPGARGRTPPEGVALAALAAAYDSDAEEPLDRHVIERANPNIREQLEEEPGARHRGGCYIGVSLAALAAAYDSDADEPLDRYVNGLRIELREAVMIGDFAAARKTRRYMKACGRRERDKANRIRQNFDLVSECREKAIPTKCKLGGRFSCRVATAAPREDFSPSSRSNKGLRCGRRQHRADESPQQ